MVIFALFRCGNLDSGSQNQALLLLPSPLPHVLDQKCTGMPAKQHGSTASANTTGTRSRASYSTPCTRKQENVAVRAVCFRHLYRSSAKRKNFTTLSANIKPFVTINSDIHIKIPLDLTLPDKVIRTTRHEAVTIAVLNIIVAREEVLFLTRSS